MFRSKTLIVGIKANVGKPGIMIATDSQVTDEDGEKKSRDSYYNKISIGRTWAMTDSGSVNQDIALFYHTLKNDPERAKREIKRAIDTEVFIRVQRTNQLVAKTKSPQDTHEFILGTNYPELGLYHIDEYGNIKEAEDCYLIVGSNIDPVRAYIEEQLTGKDISAYEINLERAIRLGYFTVRNFANKDIKIGNPPCITIVTPRRVIDFTLTHWKAIEDAEMRSLENIIKIATK